MEVKIDRRIGYVVRAFVWKGRVDQARAFAQGVKRQVEAAENLGSEAMLWARLILKPGPAKKPH